MDKMSFWTCMVAVALMEIPCLVRTMALQTYNQSIWPVVVGTVVGNVAALVIGIALAKLAGRLPEGTLWYVHAGAGIALMGLGAYMIFDKH